MVRIPGGIKGENSALDFNYFDQRKAYGKPQAMIWADNPGDVVQSGADYDEIGVVTPKGNEGTNFIILSDHNRSSISIDRMRIENRVRMISGGMRSYYTDDKANISVSWNLLPSRAYQEKVVVDENGKVGKREDVSNLLVPTNPYSQEPYLSNSLPEDEDDPRYDPNFPENVYNAGVGVFPVSEYTADGGVGGIDMLEWYRNTIGPMWVFLAYDKYRYDKDTDQNLMNNGITNDYRYSERIQMFFSSFNYSVEKRGLYDMWNISVSLEEV